MLSYTQYLLLHCLWFLVPLHIWKMNDTKDHEGCGLTIFNRITKFFGGKAALVFVLIFWTTRTGGWSVNIESGPHSTRNLSTSSLIIVGCSAINVCNWIGYWVWFKGTCGKWLKGWVSISPCGCHMGNVCACQTFELAIMWANVFILADFGNLIHGERCEWPHFHWEGWVGGSHNEFFHKTICLLVL